MRRLGMLLVIFCSGSVPAGAGQPWPEWLSRLESPSWPVAGRLVKVASVSELYRAVERARPGDTIAIANGHYFLTRYLEIRANGVTLRSLSNNPAGVVLDGSRSRHGELIGITACSNVTIACLTIQNVKWNGIKLNSNKGVQQVTIYSCIIHNVWQRGVKGVKVPEKGRARLKPRFCRIQYCLFYNDRPKRYSDDPADRPDNFGGNYIGGIDVMFPAKWIISDNVFVGIQGRTREGRGAVFLWHEAEDCLVERNVFIDCDSGICLGNSYLPEGIRFHCVGCVVRNNFVVRCPENGILADYTQNCQILHNTIHDPASRLKRLIRIVHRNDDLLVANNLLSGPAMRVETNSAIKLAGNVTGEFADLFVDPGKGDLHLRRATPGIVDRGVTGLSVHEDIDRERRDVRPDVGADEFRN